MLLDLCRPRLPAPEIRNIPPGVVTFLLQAFGEPLDELSIFT